VLYKSFLSVLDTTFIDEAVDVQNNEYCYNVKVADACGHISHFTNQSCNIILKGNAVPFEHQLAWTKYKDWYQEVNRYELFRFDDRKFITNETITPSNLRTYIDKNLDYDWGGYWYYVVAHQNDSNFKATSQSNTVYVYQPPLLWVPNAFSSNNDGINDTWGIVPVFVREYNMKVYNRWGQLVFETDNKKNDWNGDYKGRTPFDEVLIWIVTYTGWDDRVYYKKGTVTILN
jgi:gliding motility-associated-like protein